MTPADLAYYGPRYLSVISAPHRYRRGFDDWLWGNLHIQRAFEHEALMVAALGRKHYAARTIVEYLRHYTLIREANGEFKINGNWVPSMARLFEAMYPQHAGMMKFRGGWP